MKNFSVRRPLLFSILAILAPLFAMKLFGPLLKAQLSELGARLVIEALFCGYVAWLVGALGWWKEIGFSRPKAGRGYLAYAPWLLLPLVVVAISGVHPASAPRMLAFAAFALMVGFAEEVLLRGIVLRALQPGGVMRAVLLSSFFFGAGHLVGMLDGRGLQPSLVQVIYATFIGIGFAGPRLYSGSILPAIFLHFLVDFASGVARGFTLAQSKETTLHDALGAIILTGLYALYGWWLTRRSIANSAAPQAAQTKVQSPG